MNGWDFLRLINGLRQASIMISSEDVRDVQICLDRFPMIAEKQIMKALLIRRPQDLIMFESVWRIIFAANLLSTADDAGDSTRVINIEDKNSPSIGGQGVGRGFGGISLSNSEGHDVSKDLTLKINPAKLEVLMNKIEEFDDLVKAVLADMNYYTWINSYELAYQRGSLTEEEWYAHLNLRSSIIDEIRHQVLALQVHKENSWQPLARQHFLVKPLSNLTDLEKSLVKSSIRKWTQKLAVRPGQRWKLTTRRGLIDIARIVRQSVQCNGLIFKLSFHQRVPRAPELIVLCDVSNSMAPFVEFLIFLISCFKRRYRKIKVCFFIETVWDVSDFIWDEDFEDIRQKITSWGHKISLGFSDYGAAFKELAENYLVNVSARGTIVILGDGKNNYRSPQKEYIAQISERVKQIFWLNPLNVEEWNDPDNIMKHYQPFYRKAYRCRSAEDLLKIVRDVF
ncbi:VWA domain-containing protein [Desulfosporosinus sp. FKA]|uniref:VWA domain-containing protein n=1 Tax=Desulfosporosinus sp. FKA TaxID=1969834 RepID=UPI000B496F1D|nr:VWA domain-containing protein [Desulfosporosinus sp. FKA]